MTDPFWTALALKMAASAGIVVAASLAVERAGPFFGAMIVTLPISAGPAYAYLALEHGAEFIAASTLVSLAANAWTALLVVTYARLAQTRGLAASLGPALAVWLAGAALATGRIWSFPELLVVNAATYGLAFVLARGYRTARPLKRAAVPWWDLPARAFAVMGLVALVVLSGRFVGPGAAGLAALLPVGLTSMVLVLHGRVGGPATAAMLAHSLPGMVGFTAGLATLHLAAVPLGSGLALTLALAVCCAWNAGLVALRWARAR